MNCARLLSSPFLVTVALSIPLFLAAHAPSDASITSQLLIDPVGNDGAIFGSAVSSVGDVNGDGYDDIDRTQGRRDGPRRQRADKLMTLFSRPA